MSAVKVTTLTGVSGFIAPWIAPAQDAAAYQGVVKAAFLGGVDLFLLEDDSGHNPLGTLLLGSSSYLSPANGTVSNGSASFL